ncbi:unnamed protein product, partial [Mesorhabditis spiculigera]
MKWWLLLLFPARAAAWYWSIGDGNMMAVIMMASLGPILIITAVLFLCYFACAKTWCEYCASEGKVDDSNYHDWANGRWARRQLGREAPVPNLGVPVRPKLLPPAYTESTQRPQSPGKRHRITPTRLLLIIRLVCQLSEQS